jgi:hypothetical protein
MVNGNNGNIFEYFKLLLDIYDVCKGYSRRLTGDPPGIFILRNSIKTKTTHELQNHGFAQYAYTYNNIHAHTVAQYSLSTLIMRLVENYMSYVNVCGYYTPISITLCKNSFNSNVFGKIFDPTGIVLASLDAPIVQPILKSAPNIISDNISNNISTDCRRRKSEDFKGMSLPRDSAMCVRCQACSRITERSWGIHKACLDCHIKRICSKCGNAATVIGFDNFPKCQDHQNIGVTPTNNSIKIISDIHITDNNSSIDTITDRSLEIISNINTVTNEIISNINTVPNESPETISNINTVTNEIIFQHL